MATCRHDRAVLIDVTRLALRRARGSLPTGVDRVGLAHVDRHRATARAVLAWRRWSVVLRPAASRALFAWLLSPQRMSPRPWQDGLQLAGWCLRCELRPVVHGQPLLHTAHQGLECADLALGLRRRGARPVVVVHDLIPVTHPEYARCGEDATHRRRLRHGLNNAAGIVVNSQDTLRVLTVHAGRERLPLPPIVVAPLAPAIHVETQDAAPLQVPYFLVLGTVEPRKNHGLLLTLWREMVQRLGPEAPHLVVIGRRGWECQETVNLLERCPGLVAHLHRPQRCTDAALGAWLRHARALLFPSFCEGYGLPVVEALASGVPVIASDLPVLRESAGDVPDYASPIDGVRWLELVLDHARPDGPQRAAQLQRMARFQPPSWEEHHRAVDRLLASVRGMEPVA